MNLLIKMVEHHIWLVGELLQRAGKLDDERLDAPIQLSVEGVDEDPTTRSLLSRLIGQMDMWNNAIASRPYDWDVEKNESLASMRTRLAAAGPAFLAEVRSVVEEGRLDETFVDALCEPPEVFSYGGMIAHVLTFAAHRRLLVLGALASAGITDLGSGDPGKWVADAA
jgi:AraC family transcriptional regulator